ncbi:hypothetical protein Taro_039974 [Colocasia esculenta]|uniref:Uncharacterized protein n=1 Tax=Colocasia esculenta TaxID=4460 RepID=A0A843WHB6_COLES|nr:hypothetical protein [Colocasia esculenta]
MIQTRQDHLKVTSLSKGDDKGTKRIPSKAALTPHTKDPSSTPLACSRHMLAYGTRPFMPRLGEGGWGKRVGLWAGNNLFPTE